MKFMKVATVHDMHAVRRFCGLTQQAMASEMGLSKSAYVAIETEAAKFRKIHALATERIALTYACRNRDVTIAPVILRRDAVDLAGMINRSASRDKLLDEDPEE